MVRLRSERLAIIALPEALLEPTTGGQPRAPEPATPITIPFALPDAQRRFRLACRHNLPFDFAGRG